MLTIGAWDWTGVFGGVVSALVVFYVQNHQRIARTRGTQISTIAFAILVAYIWVPIGFPNSSWARAPIGTDAVRLIPFVQFDSALLQTGWLPMQLLIGGSTYFLAVLALYGDARRALVAVVGIMAVGLELSQAGANLLGNVTPPYRVDVHDVLTRAIGAMLVYAAMKVFGAIWRWRVPVRMGMHGVLGFIDSLARRT